MKPNRTYSPFTTGRLPTKGAKSMFASNRSSIHRTYTSGGRGRLPRPLAVEPLERRLLLTTAIEFSSYLSGSGAKDVAVDQDGCVYVAKGNDGTIQKFNPGGACDDSWEKSLGGGQNAIALHGDSVYVTGNVTSDFKTVVDQWVLANSGNVAPFQGEPGGNHRDAFVAKLSASGDVEYATFLGGAAGNEAGRGIAVDGSGVVYVTGHTGDDGTFPNFPDPPDPGAGDHEAFVVKLIPDGELDSDDDGELDPDDQLVYSTLIGGSGLDHGRGIALVNCDGDGANCEAYVTGRTKSTDFALPTSPPDFPYNGGEDGFVVKLDSAGNLDAAAFLGGSGDDRSLGIDLDASGNVYVTGDTASSDFPVSDDTERNGTSDTFVVKFEAEADPGSALTEKVYSTLLGGNGAEGTTTVDNGSGAIAVEPAGIAYVAGTTASSIFPTVDPINDTDIPYDGSERSGKKDVFVARIETDGSGSPSVSHATYLGGDGRWDLATSIVVDGPDNVWVAGYTNSSDFPITNGSAWEGPAGPSSMDPFVTKLSFQDSTSPPPPPPPPPTPAPDVDSCAQQDPVGPGDSTTVAVGGFDFQPGATADFGSRVMVRGVTFVSSMQLEVEVKIHRRASSGTRAVTITNPDSQADGYPDCLTISGSGGLSAPTASSDGTGTVIVLPASQEYQMSTIAKRDSGDQGSTNWEIEQLPVSELVDAILVDREHRSMEDTDEDEDDLMALLDPTLDPELLATVATTR